MPRPLQKPTAPLRDFLVVIDVTLRAPLPAPGGGRAIGYVVTLGIRCPPGDWRRLVASAIEDGDVEWERTSAEEIDIRTDVEPDLLAEASLEGEGVWYRGGRAFFGSPG
jgi:hypothetical protein